MTKNVDNHPATDPTLEDDCGCGCNGAGDCHDEAPEAVVEKGPSKGRRALLLGAGTVAVFTTLGNRRAFAAGAQCGPISHAGSLNNSQQVGAGQCGGLTPGFWRTHANCVKSALGGSSTFKTIKLGAKLSNLSLVDSTAANTTFKAALCNSSSAAFHWAGAILNALTPGMNPNYGYTISSLNAAILAASQQDLSGTTILNALITLENDFGTNNGGCANVDICA